MIREWGIPDELLEILEDDGTNSGLCSDTFFGVTGGGAMPTFENGCARLFGVLALW